MELEIQPLIGELDLTFIQITRKYYEHYAFNAVCHCSERGAETMLARTKENKALQEGKPKKLIENIMELPILKSPAAIREYAEKHPDIRINEGGTELYGFKVSTEDFVAYVKCDSYETVNNIDIVGYTPEIEKAAKPMRINYMIDHPDETLPEMCFTTLPDSGELVCVKCKESGYYPCSWSTNFPNLNRRTADHCNEVRGVSREQEEAMVIGSMGKWKALEREDDMEEPER